MIVVPAVRFKRTTRFLQGSRSGLLSYTGENGADSLVPTGDPPLTMRPFFQLNYVGVRYETGASSGDRTRNLALTKSVRYLLRHRSNDWRPVRGSNPRLLPGQGSTLASELTGQ